jgi:hypothetical protein
MLGWLGRGARGVLNGLMGRPASRERGRAGRRVLRPRLDGLETRVLLDAGPVGGSRPISSVVSAITVAGQSSTLDIQLQPNQFAGSRLMRVILAATAAPSPGSTAQPVLNQVRSAQGLPTNNIRTSQGPLFANIFVPLGQATSYRIWAAGQNLSTGTFLTTFYLAGDVNGDGVVDRTDLGAVQAAYGSNTSSSRYNASADFNGDGVVGALDMIVTNRNLGARTSVIKIVSD